MEPLDPGLTSSAILDLLFEGDKIRVCRSGLFGQPLAPKGHGFDFDRIEGMLLGLAVGDALGVTSEGMLTHRRRAAFGEIRDYLPNKYNGQRRGYPSDDTQLAFWSLKQMIADKGFIPANVARSFCRHKIFGLGSTVREFIGNHKAGLPWHGCGPASAGNGALMRIAPMLVPHLWTGGTGLWVDTALSAMITHNDAASIAACVTFVAMLWELADMKKPPPQDWWVQRYVSLAREMEKDTRYASRVPKDDYDGSLWNFVATRVPAALEGQTSTGDACNQWYSGAYLLETVPSVLMILSRHAEDPQEAIVRAVNDTRDNDTAAAIVGAAVGALHGRHALPGRWIENLTGRTTDSDDGEVFRLIQQARTTFGPPADCRP